MRRRMTRSLGWLLSTFKTRKLMHSISRHCTLPSRRWQQWDMETFRPKLILKRCLLCFQCWWVAECLLTSWVQLRQLSGGQVRLRNYSKNGCCMSISILCTNAYLKTYVFKWEGTWRICRTTRKKRRCHKTRCWICSTETFRMKSWFRLSAICRRKVDFCQPSLTLDFNLSLSLCYSRKTFR